MMEQGMIYEICGWVASIGMILGYLPQAIETIQKNTDEVQKIILNGQMYIQNGDNLYTPQGQRL